MAGILALDPGAAFGWSYFSGAGEPPKWGHLRVAAKGDESGKVGSALSIFLRARIEAFQPSVLIHESVYVPVARKPRFARAGTFVGGALPGILAELEPDTIPMNPLVLARLYGMTFLIRTIAFQHRIDCMEATTGEFCSYFLGRRPPRGRAAKKQANIAMCELLGWKPVTQDEADALALGAYAEARLFPEAAMKRAAGPLFALDGRMGGGSI